MTQHHQRPTLSHAGAGKSTIPTEAPVTSSDNDHNEERLSDEDIRLCAYQKWEAAGKPAGDGVPFWLEAEQELLEGKKEKFVQQGGGHGHHEHERLEAEKAVKAHKVSEDSHYRNNNRMFQSHGDRGHRHGGGG